MDYLDVKLWIAEIDDRLRPIFQVHCVSEYFWFLLIAIIIWVLVTIVYYRHEAVEAVYEWNSSGQNQFS